MSIPGPDELIASDLALHLGVDVSDLDGDRADHLMALAYQECLSVVDPLPLTAVRVILDVSARAYTNPTQVQSETVGPYTVQRPWAGVYLTKGDRAALTRGSGGAFTVTPMAADAGAGLVDPFGWC